MRRKVNGALQLDSHASPAAPLDLLIDESIYSRYQPTKLEPADYYLVIKDTFPVIASSETWNEPYIKCIPSIRNYT